MTFGLLRTAHGLVANEGYPTVSVAAESCLLLALSRRSIERVSCRLSGANRTPIQPGVHRCFWPKPDLVKISMPAAAGLRYDMGY